METAGSDSVVMEMEVADSDDMCLADMVEEIWVLNGVILRSNGSVVLLTAPEKVEQELLRSLYV